MSGTKSDQILEQNNRGIPYGTIAKNFPWNSLTPQDRERLMSEAERLLDDGKGYNLLSAIYVMIGNEDPWSSVRVLALAYRRSDSDTARKQNIVKSIRAFLDKIYAGLNKSPKDSQKIHRYNSFKGDYQVMNAQLQIEAGDIQGAIQNLKGAVSIYQSNGFADYASEVQKQIDNLEQRKTQDAHLIPIEHLRNERAELEQQINRYREEATKQITNLEQLQAEIKKQLETGAALTSQIREDEKKAKNAHDEAAAQEKQLQKVREKLQAVEGSLQFLTVLPKAAQAPLWVEVVRFAMDQGKMDDLTRKAIERLTIPCPREAIPVLVEIAARSPEPFVVDQAQVGPGMAKWFALIAEARSLEKKDEMQAAQKLVDAWDTFFAAAGGNGND